VRVFHAVEHDYEWDACQQVCQRRLYPLLNTGHNPLVDATIGKARQSIGVDTGHPHALGASQLQQATQALVGAGAHTYIPHTPRP
jgi:hypothetical protein